jgi:hypothetical protein
MIRTFAVWLLILPLAVLLFPLIVVACLLAGKNPAKALMVGFPRLITRDGKRLDAGPLVARVKRGEITTRQAIFELGAQS